MASSVEICNDALQLLGQTRIVLLTDNNVGARACANAYDSSRQSELRAHRWAFAITRAQLPESATPPAFGRAHSYPLPTGCLRLLPPYPEQDFNSRDWIIEGRAIYTNDAAPLNIRYIDDIVDPNLMDVLFQRALSAAIALQICEELTQSNTKNERARAVYIDAIREARRTNGIEARPSEPPEDRWITARL
jgi:hypothetical protein